MATANEKQLLGLGPDASDEDVVKAIEQLQEAASAPSDSVDVEAVKAEAKAEAEANAEAKIQEARSETERLSGLLQAANDKLEESPTVAPTENVGAPASSNETYDVTIKIRGFPYYKKVIDPVTENEVNREFIATRGDQVTLSRIDYRRGVQAGAFVDVEQDDDPDLSTLATPVASLGASASDASVQDLAEWLQSDPKPTVPQVVDAADGDAETAAKLIDAENLATGQQPRTTLVEQLQEIIDRPDED